MRSRCVAVRRNGSSIHRFERPATVSEITTSSAISHGGLGSPVMYGVNMKIGQCQR